jgi:glycerol 3-phosphatase-2
VGTWAIDLDGVVWRGDRLLDGSAAAIAALVEAGEQVVFCTNHAQGAEVKRQQLAALGVPAAPVVTSAEAAAAACSAGSRVLVMGERSLARCLDQQGLAVVDVWELPDGEVPEVDTVVVGACPRWDRSRVGMAADAVRAGATFLATNDDPTYPVTGPHGPRLLPGNGALVAAVAVAAGALAQVTGKPHAPMASLLVARHGPIDVVVGDKPETDGLLAQRLGARFGLVLSGVTSPEDLPVEPDPWQVASDLASLVEGYLGGRIAGAGT